MRVNQVILHTGYGIGITEMEEKSIMVEWKNLDTLKSYQELKEHRTRKPGGSHVR